VGESSAGDPEDDYEELLNYKFRVSNCCSFSTDGRRMYFADTPTRSEYEVD
jgi:sugar lactone lactonase YvrE